MAHQYYDIIGDVHGHADQLDELLFKMDYRIEQHPNGVRYHTHPEGRLALFIGDLIDRGPHPDRVLKIVHAMWANQTAVVLMGNHEDNLLAMLTKKDENLFKVGPNDSLYLRPHTRHNLANAEPTWSLFQSKSFDAEMYTNWMRCLPVFFETPHFRAVHACWDDQSVRFLTQALQKLLLADGAGYIMNPVFFQQAWNYLSPEYLSIETILKGKEAALPDEQELKGSDGVLRKNFRLKWWMSKSEMQQQKSLKNIAFFSGPSPQITRDKDWVHQLKYRYQKEPGYSSAKPLFFGHYWLEGKPEIITDKLACVDYSVSNEGKLAAYRWSGEQKLISDHFCWVG